MYRFEHKISTKDGSQPSGRLAYAGLSGGFGTISVGQIWNAAYNHAGAITDKSYYFGNAGTGYRHGNAISYAFSSGIMSAQLDLVADGDTDTGKGIDKTEFGVTVGLGEIGKVAIAHTNMRDHMVTSEKFVKGTLPTLNPGEYPTLNPGEYPTLNPGEYPTLNPGEYPTLNPGEHPTLNPGEHPTLNPGEHPTLNPGVYPQTKYKPVDVTPSGEAGEGFDLELDDDGNVQVVDGTRWVATGITDRKTADVTEKMHKTKVDTSAGGGGALDASSTADTHFDRDATPVVLITTVAAADALPATATGALLSAYTKTVDEETGQITYTLKACTAATCDPDTNSRAVFVVEYRGGAGIDPDSGVAPQRLTFVDGDSGEIMHTAKTQEPDGTDDGTPPSLTDGTLPSLTDGTLPSLTDGTLPSLTDGTLPSLTDGTPPSLTDGTPPSLTDGTPPTLTGGSVSDMVKVTEMKPGHKSTHVAVEFNVGGVTPLSGPFHEESERCCGAGPKPRTLASVAVWATLV